MHHLVETNEREVNLPRVCARCGATISSRMPGQRCGACLLEAALAGETNNPVSIRPSAPLLLDFGDYELLEEIGRGGQGVVFRAHQKSLNRTVALKVIGLGPWATDAHLKRFRLEAEAAARLNHSRIVPIYEIGERDGSCYFSMQCIEGGQLDQVVRHKQLSIRGAVELILKLARTVHYAHERGILHRDIKPGNILLDKDGEPHLTDFGLARLVETESTVTGTMEVLGTPSYIAPEQAVGDRTRLTSVTDVYGLGAVLYQLLTAHPPFAGGTTYETIRLVLESEPRRPRLWNPKVDRDLETICLKCLEKDPSRRYSSALELAEDLERWLRHEPIRARRTGLAGRAYKWSRRNPALAILVPLLVALLAIVAVLFWRSESEQPGLGIAVLPFENLGGAKEDSAFADGIQDDILTKLAKIADLKVISRTSVMQYRGEQNSRRLGQALRVSHLLEGSVRKEGGRVRLNAQLIDARTDKHVWAEQYDRDLTDVFAIQSELAQNIAAHLRTKISVSEKAAIETRPTHDLEAYEMYVHAKELLKDVRMPAIYDAPKIDEAIALLEKAVARDPSFALAYSSLAEAELDRYWQEPHAAADRAQAQRNLDTAHRLAPETGETHFAQAYYYYYGERDYHRALGELEIAMGLLPNDAEVFSIAGRIDRRLNRWTDSIRHYSRANELDPGDSRYLFELAGTYQILRRYNEAEEIADRGIATFPDAAQPFWLEKSETALARGDTIRARKAMEIAGTYNWFLPLRIAMCERNFAEAERASVGLSQDKAESAHYPPSFWRTIIAVVQGERDKGYASFLVARNAYEKMSREQGQYTEELQALALLDAFFGSKEDALREIQSAMDAVPASRDPLTGNDILSDRAIVYAWLGERDKAFEQLTAISRSPNSPTVGDLKLNPIWDPLRDDPRFPQLIAEAAEPIALE